MSSLVTLLNSPYKRFLIEGNVAYNENSLLDIYSDPRRNGRKRPVIIFWYGGSWTNGSKELYRFVADHLAWSTGAIIVVPDYQKYPDVKYPTFIKEAWQAVDWMRNNISRFGGDPANYSVVGHSSGGHTAGLIALGAYRPKNLHLPKRCVALAAPNCFVGADLKKIFGPASSQKWAFPNDFAADASSNNKSGFLLLQGKYDRVIYPRQQTDFLDTLEQNGISARLNWTKTSHVGQVLSIGSPFARFTRSARIVRDFLAN